MTHRFDFVHTRLDRHHVVSGNVALAFVHAGEPVRRQAVKLGDIHSLAAGLIWIVLKQTEGPVETLAEDLAVIIQIARQVAKLLEVALQLFVLFTGKEVHE